LPLKAAHWRASGPKELVNGKLPLPWNGSVIGQPHGKAIDYYGEARNRETKLFCFVLSKLSSVFLPFMLHRIPLV